MSDPAQDSPEQTEGNPLARAVVALLPVWVVLVSLVAWFMPAPFAALKPGIVPGLGLIMLGMGMTLSITDFLRVLRMPRAVACGLLGQFTIMPLLALVLAKSLRLEPELALGMVLVGACPGGTASNVVAYLARADVALSVTMTAVSTLAAVVLTPALVWWLGSSYVPVNPAQLLWTVVKVVLLPVGTGVVLHHWLQDRLKDFLAFFPLLSVVVIVLIIAAVVGLSHDRLARMALPVVAAVVLHNSLGLGLGYGLGGLFRLPTAARRTVAIEVGMQNSGLAVALASQHFTAIAALPGSLFSVVHNLTGAIVAAAWRRSKV